jgi:hypothetical protein
MVANGHKAQGERHEQQIAISTTLSLEPRALSHFDTDEAL